jgi:hypothetical protein
MEKEVDRSSGPGVPGIWPAPEQLQDLLPGDVAQELIEGGMPVRVVASARGAEQPVVVQPDQGADGQALSLLVAAPSALQVAGGDAVLDKEGLASSTVEGRARRRAGRGRS